MRHDWQYLSLLLASDVVVAQRVLQGSVQHFQSDAAGPWQPLLSLGFGTPPQEIVGIFDTGSSDTIIPKAGSELCQVNNQQCTEPAPVVLGEFDPEVASDVKELKGETFDAGFSGGDEFNGEYIETTISVGDDGGGEIPGAQVALASGGQPSGDFPQFSIFGTGPREAEATDQKYDNLPQIMKNAGVVKGNSYSVVMNPTPLANGSVFFGGIDRSKFSGELQKVAIDRDDSGKISDYVVKMTSLKLDMGGSSNKTAKLTKNQKRAHRSLLRRGVRRRSIRQRNGGNATTPGLIDLGLKKKETFTLFDTGGVDLQLPAGVLRKMARALDANFSEEDGLGPVECDKLSADNKLVLGFNNDKVKATMALDKIRVSEDIADPELTRAGLCEVGVSAVDPSTNLNSIGFGFFTDVYTVFDLESNSLWFAQAKGDPSAPGAQLEEFP
ncbi:putative aspartic-type endopeptidase OPSB [Beauveria bassiana]|nr:putative aspartic-type endopeptidase OPSB [Beauveria bassiana]KAH8711076.1 putative aspartic-type endopeptidase OPSB [Beauveria bassiana]